MIKVIIADDEEKVCQLIVGLIDWHLLDMEIVAVAHNGIEALEQIKLHKPDLMITDIRMPGCDGLELIRRSKTMKADLDFIIISGYRHFEYAQNAVKYGVGDYLLKPIKKDEFLAALHKMRNRYMQRTEQLDHEERLKIRLKSDIDILRNNLFTGLLLNKSMNAIDINDVNEHYHFSFKPGLFQVFAVKIDCGYEDQYHHAVGVLEEKILQMIHRLLNDLCYEMWIYSHDSCLYGVINYDPDLKIEIRRQVKLLLDELTAQEAAFEPFKFTVGMGKAVEDIKQLHVTYEEARSTVMQRLLLGTGKFIEDGARSEPSASARGTALLAELNKSMGAAVEVLDKDSVLNCIARLKEQIKSAESLSGEMIFTVVEQAFEMYLFHLRNNQIMLHDDKFHETFRDVANRCSSIDALFEYLSTMVEQSLKAIIEDKKQMETKPIRIVKQYIQQNFMHSISLDEVSSLVGFNPTYFSSLFKKVSGSNFVDYLSEIRMNNAKDLLRQTNLSIAAICEQVGYSDLKHFTKSFKKHTGLKPNEFRKLYS
ncbi:response regulator [Paenibacillus dakarensis]|uniref:response regulator n=1 Tax=Paenibacillus dakarensis TaxID=1527293 RepID=UPI0006D534A2|nr:response regulator [Paenibacillus dakarensis]